MGNAMNSKISAIALASTILFAACDSNTSDTQKSKVTKIVAQQQPLLSGVFVENMDTSVEPGDDFFHYVNGKLLKRSEIPADRSSYGVFAKLSDDAQEDVIAIIREASEGEFAKGSDEQKVGDMYTAYMDMEKRNAAGLMPLKGDLERIDAIESHSDLAS